MTVSAFWHHILLGTIAAKPVATAVHAGTLYAETDGAVIWRSDGSSWTAYAFKLPPGGTTGQVLTKTSGGDGDYTWLTP